MLMNREIYALELPHRAVSVYMYLRDRSDKEGRCFPAIPTIANELSLSVSTVRRAIADLEKEGLIRRESRWRQSGGQSSNLFLV